MLAFLRRSSLRVLNQSSIPTLVKRIQKGGNDSTGPASLPAHNSQILLSFVSKHCPVLYKTHVGELTKAIADEKNPRLVEVCLQALSSVVQSDDKLAPSDKSVYLVNNYIDILRCDYSIDRRTNERLMQFVLESRPRHAKFAARLLAHAKNRAEVCRQVVEVRNWNICSSITADLDCSQSVQDSPKPIQSC
jgi:sister chromatid cohesion protein PDS5